jgi:hypothetical protein
MTGRALLDRLQFLARRSPEWLDEEWVTVIPAADDDGSHHYYDSGMYVTAAFVDDEGGLVLVVTEPE